MKSFLFLVLLLSVACGGSQQSEIPQKVARSVLIVIAPKDFRDEEFKEPYDLFTKSGIKVTVASTDTIEARGMLGMVVKPDITLEQVQPDSFDALVVVGGTGCELLWDNAKLHQIVQKFHGAKKTIAAICIAPVVLGRAGVLQHVNVTAYPTVKDDIGKCGAQYTGHDVEVSGNIITCSGPQAAKDFATTILTTVSK